LGTVPAFIVVEMLVFMAKVAMIAWMAELPVRHVMPLALIINWTSALGSIIVAVIVGLIWGIARIYFG